MLEINVQSSLAILQKSSPDATALLMGYSDSNSNLNCHPNLNTNRKPNPKSRFPDWSMPMQHWDGCSITQSDCHQRRCSAI